MTAFGSRWYRMLLRLLPRPFLDRFGDAMREFHEDRLRDSRARGRSALRTWAVIVADVLTTAAVERLAPTVLPFISDRTSMQTLLQDLGYAVRGLARRPAFTAIVLATIALGVGANAAIFSVVSGVLLRPLPYPHPERVFSFGHEPPHWLTSEPDFFDYRAGMTSLDKLAAYERADATLSGLGGDPERVHLARGTEEFFPALGVGPLLGRTFAPGEFASPPRVMVISYALWQGRFGGDSAIVGKTIMMNDLPRTIVGVMPPHFHYPEARTDLWTPRPPLNVAGDRTNNFLFMVGRLKAGFTLEQARSEARVIARRIVRDHPENFDPKNPLVPHLAAVTDDLVGKARPYLVALLGAVGFILLIACVNVANLLLARGEGRRKEMALRSALGASGTRLVTQLMTESLLVAGGGAALGLAVAWGAERALVAAAPATLPRITEVSIDWRVLLFTLGCAITTAILIGVVPAARATGSVSALHLKEAGKTTRASSQRARGVLVMAEVTLAVVMLSGAGLLLRSLRQLERAGMGFDPANVLTARVSVSPRYADAQAADFFERLTSAVRGTSGVRDAGAANWLPVVDAGGMWGLRPEGGSYPEGRWPNAVPQHVTTGYFAAMGMPIVAGRDFAPTDRMDTPSVAVVSRKLAELAWPGASPIGKRFRLSVDSVYLTVVGVVNDIRSRGFDDTPEPTMYFPVEQSAQSAYFTPRSMAVLVRTDGDPLAAAGVVRAIAHAQDPAAPVSEVRTLDRVVGTSVENRRYTTALLTTFAAVALLLAGIGIYGVISYSVTQRTYEIGVRMALGAERRRVIGLVLWEGVRPALGGLVLGLIASVIVARVIRALLFGVTPFDLPTFGVAATLMGIVAVVASSLPARRASGVSPVEALRGE